MRTGAREAPTTTARRAAVPLPRGAGEERFGIAANRLAGFCCLHFGWSPDRFWRATPAEIGTVVAALVPEGPVPVTRGELRQLETGDG